MDLSLALPTNSREGPHSGSTPGVSVPEALPNSQKHFTIFSSAAEEAEMRLVCESWEDEGGMRTVPELPSPTPHQLYTRDLSKKLMLDTAAGLVSAKSYAHRSRVVRQQRVLSGLPSALWQ
jgi:hypothetical protein